jgi:hypothetical protein
MSKNQLFWAVLGVLSTVIAYPLPSLIVIGIAGAGVFGFWLANKK